MYISIHRLIRLTYWNNRRIRQDVSVSSRDTKPGDRGSTNHRHNTGITKCSTLRKADKPTTISRQRQRQATTIGTTEDMPGWT